MGTLVRVLFFGYRYSVSLCFGGDFLVEAIALCGNPRSQTAIDLSLPTGTSLLFATNQRVPVLLWPGRHQCMPFHAVCLTPHPSSPPYFCPTKSIAPQPKVDRNPWV